MTVVTAPSGYGKTTAVSAWASAHSDRVAWLTLSAFDADPSRLSAGILQALQALARSTAESVSAEAFALDAVSGDSAGALDALHTSLGEAEQPVYLVIDDAHRAAEALTAGLLGALIDVGPQALRLIIVGTSYVELALARWTLTHPRASIRADQLAFDMDEITGLLSGASGEITPQTIFEETQGWPIAVQVFQLAGVRPTSPTGHDDDLMRDYIRDHVLGSLPRDLALFVLRTSICSDLTVELATEITGRADAEALLRNCVGMGLFLDRYATEHGPVYRWHSTFTRHCREILEATHPGERARLHRAAARFYEPREPLTALSHWLRAGDDAAAVASIQGHWVGILVRGESAALERLCMQLPGEYAEDPTILLVRACAQEIAGARDVAQLLLDSAATRAAERADDQVYALNLPRAQLFLVDGRSELAQASASVRAQLRGADSGNVRDHAALLYMLGWSEMRHRRDPERTVQLLSAAAQEAEAIADRVLHRRALSHLAFVLAWTGQLRRAEQVLDTLGDHPDDEGPWNAYAGGGASTAAGLIAYYSDDLPRASYELSRAIRSGSGEQSFAGIARMLFTLAAAASKDPQMCRKAGMELQDLPGHDARGVSWTAFRHVSLAALAEAAGQRDRALSIAARYAETDDLPLVTVILAGIVRRFGDPQTALRMLRRLARYPGVSYIQASTLVTAAIVQRRRENRDLTHSYCEQALEIAVKENVRRPFCEGDLEMRQLLTEHLAWGTRYEDFVASCLRPPDANSPLETLSERERTVFDQLRTTRTMAEIAQSLEVSINTVKTHQRAIYRKLGVTSRREALRVLT